MRINPFGGHQLGFLTTNDCTADCPHCMMGCKPGNTDYLTFDQIRKVIDDYRKHAELSVVIFTGGEPTLLDKDLLRAISYCSSNGIVSRIVTNAHWADTPKAAERVLKVLYDYGLEEINFSMDDFHAPYIPIENVRNAWRAAHGMGFKAVVVANACGEKSVITPEYICDYFGETVRSVIDSERNRPGYNPGVPAADGTIYLISQILLHKTGRAKECFSEEDFRKDTKKFHHRTRCAGVVSGPNVTSNYHAGACCGVDCRDNPYLDLGDLNKEEIGDILIRAADNLVLNAIHSMGPYSLSRFIVAHEPSIVFEEGDNMCSFCERITTDPKCIEVLESNTAELAALVLACEKMPNLYIGDLEDE